MTAPASPFSSPARHPHYDVVAKAIRYLRGNAVEQPSLADVAQHVGLSPEHLQRVFSDWAGLSPKRFLQFQTKEFAKQALRDQAGVQLAAAMSGLSSPGRLHELLVTCEAMTPGDIAAAGAGLLVRHGFVVTPFGPALLAWTPRGICHLEFTLEEDPNAMLMQLRAQWPAATLVEASEEAQVLANKMFEAVQSGERLHVVLRGTNFQLKVWEALLRTQPGQLLSYSGLAELAGYPKAQRAVGSALAANVVGYLIPCHRVIRESGELGNYRWDTVRKAAMLTWEASKSIPS
jgi:AraC family transcriptional regulator, regulatory protein of adaptative response / methylated-DNA-[protein]-cysteine methyltransferase